MSDQPDNEPEEYADQIIKRLTAENTGYRLFIAAVLSQCGELRLSKKAMQDAAFVDEIHRREDLETGDLIYSADKSTGE